MAAEERFRLIDIYQSYLAFCRLVGVKPLKYPDWRETREKLNDWHDNPSAILAYNTRNQ